MKLNGKYLYTHKYNICKNFGTYKKYMKNVYIGFNISGSFLAIFIYYKILSENAVLSSNTSTVKHNAFQSNVLTI